MYIYIILCTLWICISYQSSNICKYSNNCTVLKALKIISIEIVKWKMDNFDWSSVDTSKFHINNLKIYAPGRVAEVGRLSVNAKMPLILSLGAYLLIHDKNCRFCRHYQNCNKKRCFLQAFVNTWGTLFLIFLNAKLNKSFEIRNTYSSPRLVVDWIEELIVGLLLVENEWCQKQSWSFEKINKRSRLWPGLAPGIRLGIHSSHFFSHVPCPPNLFPEKSVRVQPY